MSDAAPPFVIPEDLFLDPGDVMDCYACRPLTEEAVARAQERLGVRLPASFLAVLRRQNGGVLHRNRYRPADAKLNARGGDALAVLHGIGEPNEGGTSIDAPYAPAPTMNRYLIENWGYPESAVVFAHLGHGGHYFEYADCGPDGEPGVWFCDSEDPTAAERHPVAADFAGLLAGLIPEENLT